MLKFNNNFTNYYLKETEKLVWFKKPKVVIKKNENNHYAWFPDGQLNLYENCISNNLKKDKIKPRLLQSIKIKKLENIASYKLIKS